MKPQSARRKTLCSLGEYPLKDVTERIIACAIEVHSALGPGLLESVYEEALEQEFILRNILYEKQKEISLQYKRKNIGKHRIDYLVEGRVIVELKAVEAMNKIYEAQLLTLFESNEQESRFVDQFQCGKGNRRRQTFDYLREHRGGGSILTSRNLSLSL